MRIMGTTVRYIDEFGRDELNTEEGSLWGAPVDSRLSILFTANASFLYTPDQVTLATTGGSGFRFSGQFSVDSISTGTDLSEFSELQGTVSNLTDLSEVNGELFDRYEIDFLEPITLNELVFGSTWSTLLDGDDSLVGGDGFDYLFAYGGDDVITTGIGSDIVNGGSGVDRVVYLSEKFSIQQTDTGYVAGDDTLENIERIEFSDVSLALDLDGSAGQTAKILAAVIGEEGLSNKEYVGIGLQLFDAGQSLASVCELALTAVGATTHADVVYLLYTNLFGETPTEAQAEEYISALDAGVFTKGSLAAAAAELTDDLGVIDLVGLAETGIEYI